MRQPRSHASGLTLRRAGRMNRHMLIYKVFRASEFEVFRRDGKSPGAPVDLSDGYIHLSTAQQLPGTLAKHFAGETELHLLALEAEGLDSLRWEISRGGDSFPHLYRDLYEADILWSRPIVLGPDGHDIGEIE